MPPAMFKYEASHDVDPAPHGAHLEELHHIMRGQANAAVRYGGADSFCIGRAVYINETGAGVGVVGLEPL